MRIAILTSISGISFDETWERRETAEIDGLLLTFLSRAGFLRNQRAARRPKDLGDVGELERM
jgi:hypothetical protein